MFSLFKKHIISNEIVIFAIFLLTFVLTIFANGVDYSFKILNSYYYFYIGSASFILFIFLHSIFRNKRLSISFDIQILLMSTFILYIIFSFIFSHSRTFLLNEFSIYLVCFIIYLIVKNNLLERKNKLFKLFILTLCFLITVQFIISIGQYFGIYTYSNYYFKFGGTFINPSHLGIFSAICFLLFLGVLFFPIFNRPFFKKIIFFNLFLCLVILVFADSRASWIGVLAGSIYLVFIKKKWGRFIEKSNLIKIKGIVILLLLVVSIAIGSFFLYNYKKDSADGRIFNWKICLNIIKEKPLFGHGFGTYKENKGIYQIKYFEKNIDDTKNIALADCNPFACNDYLELGTQLGLIGVLLFLSLIAHALLVRKNDFISIIVTSGLLSFYVICLFSYPTSIIQLLILLFLLFSFQTTCNSQVFSISISKIANIILCAIVIISTVFYMIFKINEFTYIKKWEKTSEKILLNNTSVKSIEVYAEYENNLKSNPQFLYNYAYLLYFYNVNAQKSLDMFEQSTVVVQNEKVYYYIATLYEKNNNLAQAELNYKKAVYLTPHLFYPRFFLLRFYDANGMKDKAVSVANDIILMKTKIYSEAEGQIRTYALNYLNKN